MRANRDGAGAQDAAGQFPPRPFVHRDFLVLHVEEHPDSDGARLAADLFQFDAAGRFPVILTRQSRNQKGILRGC
jgi:hypothetical protein